MIFEDPKKGALENVTLTRPYGRIDRLKLKKRLLDQCVENDARVLARAATRIEHFDVGPSIVTLNDASKLEALLVVDATGFKRQFVKHDVPFDPGFQVTYGCEVPRIF